MTLSPKKRGKVPMAEQFELHDLYEEAVQAVDAEVEFLDETFRSLRGRDAVGFREDFCGTASAACEWVRSSRRRFAIGVDNDPAVLDWGRRHRVAKLSEVERARVQLLENDVLRVKTEPVDIIGAFNFSYFIFKTRAELKRYFARCREALAPDGILFLDAFGGPEALRKNTEAEFARKTRTRDVKAKDGRAILVHVAEKQKPGARVLSIVGAAHKPWFDGWLGQLQGVEIVDAVKALE